MTWSGEPQPIDTIQDGDEIPFNDHEGGGGVKLMKWLVPTLSDERAVELSRKAAGWLPLSTGALRNFIAEHAPNRI